MFQIKFRKSGGLDWETAVGRDKGGEKRGAGSCRPWNPFKESCYIKGEPPKGFKLQSFGRLKGESSTIQMYSATQLTRPSKTACHLLNIDNPQVGIINVFVREEATEISRVFVPHKKSHTSDKGQCEGLKPKKRRKRSKERGDRSGPVCPDGTKDTIRF